MPYPRIERRLRDGDIVVLDGGIGTELERRGVPMDPEAWCGAAALNSGEVLEGIHLDYIAAGADIVTANTYASSRLMLELSGHGDRFEEINRAAIGAALRARDASGRRDVLIAGSISHRAPITVGSARPDRSRRPSVAAMEDALAELATLLRDEGCELILLEMMYNPELMEPAFAAATKSGLPVWAGFSARRGDDGRVLSFLPDADIPIEDLFRILERYDVAAAGLMHSQANVIGDAVDILRATFDGPLLAYPDSGYFRSPQWVFEEVIPPREFHRFSAGWVEQGVRIVGGCCGLSPDHIAALGPLKHRPETPTRRADTKF